MSSIYHIVTKESWEAQKGSEVYIHSSLNTEGFIHASTLSQLQGVLNRYYKGVTGLYRLTIDPTLLESTSELKEELAISIGEMFPHIYGPINKSAIIEVTLIR